MLNSKFVKSVVVGGAFCVSLLVSGCDEAGRMVSPVIGKDFIEQTENDHRESTLELLKTKADNGSYIVLDGRVTQRGYPLIIEANRVELPVAHYNVDSDTPHLHEGINVGDPVRISAVVNSGGDRNDHGYYLSDAVVFRNSALVFSGILVSSDPIVISCDLGLLNVRTNISYNPDPSLSLGLGDSVTAVGHLSRNSNNIHYLDYAIVVRSEDLESLAD